jgi:hypothetical protein
MGATRVRASVHRCGLALLTLGAIAGCRDRAVARAADGTRAPVLVELFTSEGCSSCPPAEAELARLVATQPIPSALVIPVAMHVDYWDELGWPDPFAAFWATARQRSYASAGRGSIYTPEAIVDGDKDFVGSDDNAARSLIESAARAPRAQVVLRVSGAARGMDLPVSISVAPLPPGADAADLVLAVTEGGLRVEVKRGENAGKTLTHDGVARSLAVIAEVPRAGGTFDGVAGVAAALRRENVRIVAFVQERRSRRVLGVGVLASL